MAFFLEEKLFSVIFRSLIQASTDEGDRQQVEDYRRCAQLCSGNGSQGEGIWLLAFDIWLLTHFSSVPEESSAPGAYRGRS